MAAAVALYEDDVGIRTLLLDLLEGEGFATTVCASLLEVHQAACKDARVAVVDSWGASYQTLEAGERDQIRALARLIPTILLSGRTWAEQVNADELSLVALVKKPFDIEELLRYIRPFVTSSSGVS